MKKNYLSIQKEKETTPSKNKFIFTTHKYLFFSLIFVIVGWLLFNFFLGERIQFNNGLGWDGEIYASIASHFKSTILEHQLSRYYVSRIFPSSIVYLIAKLFGYSLSLPKNASNIIHIFYVFNSIIYAIGIYGYYKIAKRLNWNFNVFIIGFSALFLNFSTLKLMTYYPVLTDYTALTLGILMLYFYLQNNVFRLILISLLSAFTFPSMLLTSIILLLFPKQTQSIQKKYSVRHTLTFSDNFLLRLKILLASLGLLISVVGWFWLKSHNPTVVAVPEFTLLCIMGTIFYLLLMTYPFLRKKYSVEIIGWRLCFTFIFFGVITLIQYLLSNHSAGPVTYSSVIIASVYQSFLYPFVFLVCHFFYYGPVILLIILYWYKIVDYAFESSIGLGLLLFMYGFLAINPQSRCWINAMPIFVFLLCQVISTMHLTKRFTYGMVGLSILMSRFWLTINLDQWPIVTATIPPLSLTQLREFPYQFFFMNIGGAWLSYMAYKIQLIFMLIIFAILFWWYKMNLSPKSTKLFFKNSSHLNKNQKC